MSKLRSKNHENPTARPGPTLGVLGCLLVAGLCVACGASKGLEARVAAVRQNPTVISLTNWNPTTNLSTVRILAEQSHGRRLLESLRTVQALINESATVLLTQPVDASEWNRLMTITHTTDASGTVYQFTPSRSNSLQQFTRSVPGQPREVVRLGADGRVQSANRGRDLAVGLYPSGSVKFLSFRNETNSISSVSWTEDGAIIRESVSPARRPRP